MGIKKVVSSEIASMQGSNNKLNNTVYTLTEALSSIDEAVIRGSVIKAYVLVLFLVLTKATVLWSRTLAQMTFLIILTYTRSDLLNVTLVALDTRVMDFAAMR